MAAFLFAFSIFLSTPSARRATCGHKMEGFYNDYFYPRPPRGGRQAADTSAANIHIFLSTPSARRATNEVLKITAAICISIHALREEGDASSPGSFQGSTSFLSTPSARRATCAALS